MALDVLKWVAESDPPPRGAPRAVLWALAWHAHADGTGARPSQSTLARESGLSERAVRDALLDLEAAGTIEREGHAANGGTVIWRVIMTPAGPAPAAGPRRSKIRRTIRRELPDRTSTSTPVDPAAGAARSGETRRTDPAPGADKQSVNGHERSERPRAETSQKVISLEGARQDRRPASGERDHAERGSSE